MRAIEMSGIVDEQGNLSLERPVEIAANRQVRVIILYAEETVEAAQDLVDTPVEEVKASLRQALEEAKVGQRIPLAQMWDEIEA